MNQILPAVLTDKHSVSRLLGVSLQTLGRVSSLANRVNSYHYSLLLKSNGKNREIHAVQGNLKRLQKRLLVELQSRYSATPYAHGFVPEKSIVTNALVHRKKRLVIKVDIKDFFPSINFPRVVGMFRVFPFNFGQEASKALASIVCLPDQSGQLPQGGVTSPYIANMIARRLDMKLAKLAKQNRCGYTRYADDITFSTNDVKSVNVETLVEAIYGVIREEHFVPNEEKTRVLTPRQRQVVAGIVVNSGLSVNRKYLRNIRATLYNCEKAQDILNQITKFDFKDQRSSRTNLRPNNDGTFDLNGTLLSAEDAVAHFFRHIAGQLSFVLQTVKGNPPPCVNNGDGAAGTPIKRVGEGAIDALYLRYYELLKKLSHRYETLRPLKNSIARLVHRSDLLRKCRNQLDLQDKRANAKELSRIRYHETSLYKRAKLDFESIQDMEDLKSFCASRSSDPRYALTLRLVADDFQVAKSAVAKLIEYPALSLEFSRKLFKSIQEGELSEFFHQPRHFQSPPSATTIISSFIDEFYPYFYHLPIPLRLRIEDYIEVIAKEGAELGMDEPLSLIDSPNLVEETAQLQKSIRFADPDMEDGRCTSLHHLITEIATSVQNSVKISRKKKVKFHIGEIDDTKIFTHVQSVEKGLQSILKTVAEHAKKNEVVEISMQVAGTERTKRRSLSITSHQERLLPGTPGNGFYLAGGGGGDLSNAIRALNGIAKYYVEGNFSEGRYIVNMIDGSLAKCPDGEKLIHKIEL